VTIIDNANDGPQQVPLTGTGVVAAPVVSLSPTSLGFADQAVNTTSQPQQITLTNIGNGELVIASIVAEGDFAQSNSCGSSVPAGGSCTIDVTFTPTSQGPGNGTITVTDNAGDSPQIVTLAGNGIAPGASLSPPALDFGDQPVGTTSNPQPITLTNVGTAPLNLTGIESGGDFAQTNDCTSPLAPSASCTINVTFSPTQAADAIGVITVTDDAADSPQTVSLHGNGIGG
jgi:hypothetical protein